MVDLDTKRNKSSAYGLAIGVIFGVIAGLMSLGGAIQVASFFIGWFVGYSYFNSTTNRGGLLKLFYLFDRKDLNLSEKWWHRLIKVVYLTALILTIIIISTLHANESFVLKNDSNTYTEYDETIEIVDANREISSDEIEEILDERPPNTTVEGILDGLIMRGYSIEGVDTSAARERIIETERLNSAKTAVNSLYHLQGLVYGLLILLVVCLVMQFIYYKMFLYIVLGNNPKTTSISRKDEETGDFKTVSKSEFKKHFLEYAIEGSGYDEDYWNKFYEHKDDLIFKFKAPIKPEENRLFIVTDSKEVRMFLVTEESEESFFEAPNPTK